MPSKPMSWMTSDATNLASIPRKIRPSAVPKIPFSRWLVPISPTKVRSPPDLTPSWAIPLLKLLIDPATVPEPTKDMSPDCSMIMELFKVIGDELVKFNSPLANRRVPGPMLATSEAITLPPPILSPPKSEFAPVSAKLPGPNFDSKDDLMGPVMAPEPDKSMLICPALIDPLPLSELTCAVAPEMFSVSVPPLVLTLSFKTIPPAPVFSLTSRAPDEEIIG